MTLLEAIELYLETKGNLKPSSLREYHHLPVIPKLFLPRNSI
ncbi:hypothetical protein [Ileibacterium valens]|nr:hypothetical protein [Ileibacterium valens]